jgi:hypothetical protein
MALITIEDLPQSDDLDREAMRLIVGGGHITPGPVQLEGVPPGSSRIVEYPPGFPIGRLGQRNGVVIARGRVGRIGERR